MQAEVDLSYRWLSCLTPWCLLLLHNNLHSINKELVAVKVTSEKIIIKSEITFYLSEGETEIALLPSNF